MIKRKKKGFSLIEMLVVIAIIAVLVAIVTPVIAKSTLKAAAATNAANLRAAKGAFTTMKLMYPEDYTTWTSGLNARTGIDAVSEQFVVSGNAADNNPVDEGTPALQSASDGSLFVAAPSSEGLKLPDRNFELLEGTVMNAQILNNDDGTQEVYVTYNGYPIAFFAEIAETGDADPEYYRNLKGAGNLLANQAYIDRYLNRVADLYKNLDMGKINLALGETLGKQVGDLLANPESAGDCIECAVNSMDFTPEKNGGLLLGIVGEKIENKLTNKGYDSTKAGNCPGYKAISPTNEGCSNCHSSHGKQAHISTTSKVNVGTGFENEACPKGGTHTYTKYDTTHTCTQCKQSIHAECVYGDDSLPYIGALIQDSCIYCETCPCCIAGSYHKPGDALSSGEWYDGIVSGVSDLDVCVALDPVTGGTAKGCGHPMYLHTTCTCCRGEGTYKAHWLDSLTKLGPCQNSGCGHTRDWHKNK